MNQKPHILAMINEILDYPKPRKNQNFLDAGFGAKRHSQILADVNDTKCDAFLNVPTKHINMLKIIKNILSLKETPK